MYKYYKFLFGIVLIVGLYSCVPHKKIVYFQNNGTIKGDTINSVKQLYKVQPNDVLTIQVNSFNPELTDFFNSKVEGKAGGYTVYPSGYIHIPILDSVYVNGLTIYQIEDSLEKHIGEHVIKPYISVNLLNIKFLTLGEFGNKGLQSVSGNDLTILEAIAIAGDMTDVADKKHVKLIRKSGDKNVIITLNLNNRDIMGSPYYYIHPNDIIYAEPLKVKALRTNITQISTYLGVASFLFIIYNFIAPKL